LRQLEMSLGWEQDSRLSVGSGLSFPGEESGA
jgi:hypothetical protein